MVLSDHLDNRGIQSWSNNRCKTVVAKAQVVHTIQKICNGRFKNEAVAVLPLFREVESESSRTSPRNLKDGEEGQTLSLSLDHTAERVQTPPWLLWF